MVSTASAVSVMGNISNAAVKHKKALGLGTLATVGFCLFDFWEVPSAFNIKYDYDAKKVDGLNISAGAKETAWSAVKCAAGLALPAVIGLLAGPLGPVAATICSVAKIASPFLSYACLEKLRPHEKEVIQKICEAKGIDITKPDNSAPSINETGTLYA